MATKRTSNDQKLMRPATTPEGRENQLIALATDLVERRLRDGSATSQEVCHFLKMASPREQMERLKMQHETELLQARADNIANSESFATLAKEAIAAFRVYSGQGGEDDDDDQDV